MSTWQQDDTQPNDIAQQHTNTPISSFNEKIETIKTFVRKEMFALNIYKADCNLNQVHNDNEMVWIAAAAAATAAKKTQKLVCLTVKRNLDISASLILHLSRDWLCYVVVKRLF